MQEEKNNPFPDIVTDDWSFLDDGSSRTKCPKCNKSRKYYCYSCCIALPHIQDKLPRVRLPLKVDIIKHPGELDGKSTAPHASILAPDDVTIHTFPCIPNYSNQKVIIVFPGEDAVTLDDLKAAESDNGSTTIKTVSQSQDIIDYAVTNEIDYKSNLKPDDDLKNNSLSVNSELGDHGSCQKHSSSEVMGDSEHLSKSDDTAVQTSQLNSHDLKRKRVSTNEDHNERTEAADIHKCKESGAAGKHQKTQLRQCPYERVVFVDCKWNQTKQIVNDERLQGLKKVELKSQFTHFWRSQEGMPKTYLSTIEAIYFFFKDFHSIFVDPIYRHEYDNLLMFFCFMYHKIKRAESV